MNEKEVNKNGGVTTFGQTLSSQKARRKNNNCGSFNPWILTDGPPDFSKKHLKVNNKRSFGCEYGKDSQTMQVNSKKVDKIKNSLIVVNSFNSLNSYLSAKKQKLHDNKLASDCSTESDTDGSNLSPLVEEFQQELILTSQLEKNLLKALIGDDDNGEAPK